MKYCLDIHCHTVSSGHAFSTVKEYIDQAQAIGIKLVGFTDHAPKMPGAPSHLHFFNLKAIPSSLNGIQILKGAELNIMDTSGELDLPNGILKNLDVVIAGFHLPCFKPASQYEHTRAVINVMKNPYVKIIGHLGDPRYPVDMKEVVYEARERKIVLEINNASFASDSSRHGGEENIFQMAELCKTYGVPVILSSDAHIYTELANFSSAGKVIDTVGIPEHQILNTSVELLKQYMGNGVIE